MTNLETAVNTLAEAVTTELSKQRNPKTIEQNRNVAKAGGKWLARQEQTLKSNLEGESYQEATLKDFRLRKSKRALNKVVILL